MDKNKDELADEIRNLSQELASIAVTLRRQSKIGNRFIHGLVFGLGTALGASFVAGIAVVIISQLLSLTGLEIPSGS